MRGATHQWQRPQGRPCRRGRARAPLPGTAAATPGRPRPARARARGLPTCLLLLPPTLASVRAKALRSRAAGADSAAAMHAPGPEEQKRASPRPRRCSARTARALATERTLSACNVLAKMKLRRGRALKRARCCRCIDARESNPDGYRGARSFQLSAFSRHATFAIVVTSAR